jgi:transposase
MSYEEEEIFLSQFTNEANGGHITDVKAIKAAYDEKVGHKTGHGQIYFVLHRHGWSKKLPRSKHPKSADPKAVEASKKLTLESTN